MDELQILNEQLKECTAKRKELLAEVEKLRAPIDDQLEIQSKNIAQLQKKLDNVPKIITLIKVAAAALAVISFFSIGLIPAIIFGVIFILTFPLGNIIEEQLEKPINAKIDTEKQIISDLEKKCPGLSDARKALNEEISKESSINKKIKDLKLAEKLGVNNAFVCVKSAVSEQYQTKHEIPTTIVIDGVEKGFAAKPFSIISLSEGIHSIQLIYNLPSKTVTTTSLQFSVKNNNVYLCAKPIYNRAGNFECSTDKHTTPSAFYRDIGITESDFFNYINSI